MAARKPKGSYIRTTPDWFYGATANGSAFDTAATPGVEPGVGLYNDGSQSKLLFVFGIGCIVSQGNEVANVSLVKGPLTKAVAGPQGPGVIQTDPRLGAPPGALFIGMTSAQAAATAHQTNSPFFLGSNATVPGAPVQHIIAEHPLLLIPPGWSLAVWTFNAGLGAWFHYTWLTI